MKKQYQMLFFFYFFFKVIPIGSFGVINCNLNRVNADPTIKTTRDTHTAIIFAGDCIVTPYFAT